MRERGADATTVNAPDAIQRPASPTTASRRKARVIDELWEVLERAEAERGARSGVSRARGGGGERGELFEQEAEVGATAGRWPRAGLKMIEKLPFRNQWRDLVVERAVGMRCTRARWVNIAGRYACCVAAGLGCRTRTNVNHILPYR